MRTVTFCGHGDCTVSDDVKQWLYEAIETEIKNGAEQTLKYAQRNKERIRSYEKESQ